MCSERIVLIVSRNMELPFICSFLPQARGKYLELGGIFLVYGNSSEHLFRSVTLTCFVELVNCEEFPLLSDSDQTWGAGRGWLFTFPLWRRSGICSTPH